MSARIASPLRSISTNIHFDPHAAKLRALPLKPAHALSTARKRRAVRRRQPYGFVVADFKFLKRNLMAGHGPPLHLPACRRRNRRRLARDQTSRFTGMEMTMKTLVSALTAAVLLAGIGGANALDEQTTSTEIDNALSHEVASPGAYASARLPGRVVVGPEDPQAQGSN